MSTETDFIERLKGVQLRGNTPPKDSFLLQELVAYLQGKATHGETPATDLYAGPE